MSKLSMNNVVNDLSETTRILVLDADGKIDAIKLMQSPALFNLLVQGSPAKMMHCWQNEQIQYILNYCKHLFKQISMPFVSVGSGDGKYEQMLIDGSVNVICVDNQTGDCAPKSFVHYPEYATCDDLLADNNQHLIDNCVLLLFWPYDNHRSTELQTSLNKTYPYDVEAVVKLQPKHIIILYEEYGAAASALMHDWLSYFTTKTELGCAPRDETKRRLNSVPDDLLSLNYVLESEKNWKYESDKYKCSISRFDHLFVKSIMCVHLAKK